MSTVEEYFVSRSNKNMGICFSAHGTFVSGRTFTRYALNQKIGKPNNLKVAGSKDI